MAGQGQAHSVIADIDIRMVVGSFRSRRHLVRESDRTGKIWKLELPENTITLMAPLGKGGESGAEMVWREQHRHGGSRNSAGILKSMPKLGVAALFLLLTLPSYARILGVFQGQVVEGPAQNARGRWLTVQSRNGYTRKVEITRAKFIYDASYPVKERQPRAERSVQLATLVRVTAEKDKSKQGDGAWRATEVLILPRPGSPAERRGARTAGQTGGARERPTLHPRRSGAVAPGRSGAS